MPHGGARPNSGPDKGVKYAKTISREEQKEMLREMLRPHLATVVAALIEKASEKDIPAIKEYLERLMGKVTEEVDHTSGGRPLFLPSELLIKNNLACDTPQGTETDSE